MGAIKVYSKDALAQHKSKVAMPADLRLRDHVREARTQNGVVYEFIGTDSFGSEWNERRRYEVDAGRDEEPILYTPIYDVINDSNLPKNVSVQRMGPGGVVLSEINEGGEVTFATIESSEFSVPIKHYGVGSGVQQGPGRVQRAVARTDHGATAVGIAYNALLNHLHFNPILTATAMRRPTRRLPTRAGDNDGGGLSYSPSRMPLPTAARMRPIRGAVRMRCWSALRM